MGQKNIVVIEGDDAAPEAMRPTVEILTSLIGDQVTWHYPVVGEAAVEASGTPFPDEAKAMIDASDATLFGSTSGSSAASLFYLRWGRVTFANVRPARYLPGYQSPYAEPEKIDFVIVRENLEDMYLGIEGDIEELKSLNWISRTSRQPLADIKDGRYALKVITKEGTERVMRFSFELARKRKAKGYPGRVTTGTKHNMLRVSDGYFREIAAEVAEEFPDIEYENYIVDDFAHRMVRDPGSLDVAVLANLYGDILSDAAAGMIGGLGLAPSGCYGNDYAYFESAHGTAPDIAGLNIINPTATLLSGSMMLEHLGFSAEAERLDQGIRTLYAEGNVRTPDQGGDATTTAFCDALQSIL